MEQDYCVHPGQIMSAILLSINKSPRWLANKTNTEYATIINILEGGDKRHACNCNCFRKGNEVSCSQLIISARKI